MTESNNHSFLGSTLESVDNPNAEVMVNVDRVTMIFNMASEQLNSLKEYAIALARRELRFKEFRALDDVSFQVRRGDVFGILGTNGSGKSTVLKIIAGVLEPSSGSCTVKGNIAPLIELGAGFDMELTARENIYLNGALLGYTKQFVDSHFDEIVDFAEINDFIDMPLKNYSSGMVARIAFAIATATIPDVLIVDEVLSVGDFMFQQKCERRISSLIKDHQVTVLIVSHNTDQIERLCNKAVWIEKGHLRMIGAARDVCETYRMIGGREGSAESESLILDLMFDDTIVPTDASVRVIAGDNRYSTAAKLGEMCVTDGVAETVIVASGESRPDCLLATGLSQALDAPVFTIGPETLPDIAVHTIKQLSTKRFVVLAPPDSIRRNTVEALRAQFPDASFDVLATEEKHELACEVFRFVPRESWGDVAFLSYKECFEDLLTLAPYRYRVKAPLFFCSTFKTVSQETAGTIIDNFKKLIVVGSLSEIQESCLDQFRNAGLEVMRLVGDDVYQANEMLNEWAERELAEMGVTQGSSVIISSSWKPEHSFTLGAYAGHFDLPIVLEDPGSMDGISRAISYIERRCRDIDKLVFVGDDAVYSHRDRQLLERALIRARQRA